MLIPVTRLLPANVLETLCSEVSRPWVKDDKDDLAETEVLLTTGFKFEVLASPKEDGEEILVHAD